MKEIDKNDFICTYHKHIKNNIKKLLKLIPNDEIMKELLYEMQTCVNYAYKSGMRMENRMSLYRSTIESLGFMRVEKK